MKSESSQLHVPVFSRRVHEVRMREYCDAVYVILVTEQYSAIFIQLFSIEVAVDLTFPYFFFNDQNHLPCNMSCRLLCF